MNISVLFYLLRSICQINFFTDTKLLKPFIAVTIQFNNKITKVGNVNITIIFVYISIIRFVKPIDAYPNKII